MPILLPIPPAARPAIAWLAFASLAVIPALSAAEEPWKDLQAQNQLLRDQLHAQQRQLEELRTQVDRLAGSRESLALSPEAPASPAGDRKLVIAAEVGLAFFAAGSDGQYRNDEFRVDDANIRLEAALAKDTYFQGELQVAKREALNEDFKLGEFYLELENLSGALGGPDRLANVRIGRFDTPFGEEYQRRDPLANPLVTHSLSDVWGTDEGVEVHGEWGPASYAFTVQNGSSKTMRDFNADKAVALRVGFAVSPQLRVSASGMRTGQLASASEPLSEIWIGNNVFRNIGSSQSSNHRAELAELDATYTWATGHVWAAAGRARYRDNDPLADNTRHFDYYQVEGVQFLGRGLYGAARLSTLEVNKGYPLAGIGNFAKYFLGNLHTTELQRLSLGGGYRVNRSLVLKAEYTLENGELTTGAARDNRMFSFETALGF